MVKVNFKENDMFNEKVQLELSIGELLVLSRVLDDIENSSEPGYHQVTDDPNSLVIRLAKVKGMQKDSGIIILDNEYRECVRDMNSAIDTQLNANNITVDVEDVEVPDAYIRYTSDKIFQQITSSKMSALFEERLNSIKEDNDTRMI